MRLPLHVSVHIYDHLQGAREQCFCAVTKLDSVDVRSLRVCTVCGRMSDLVIK